MLSGDALEGEIAAFDVADIECGAVLIPEIEFGQVAVQIFGAAELTDALHAAFEDDEETFDGLGMDGLVTAFNVFA